MSSSVLQLHVQRSFRLSSSFQRVVVAGEELERLPDHGYDHWFRLFFRQPRQRALSLPQMSADSWYQQWLAHPEDSRPVCRNYTVRQFRRTTDELDIDFVLHPGATGLIDTPAAQWAVNATAGESLGLLDQGATFVPPDPQQPVLLAGDETALPAIEGILRSLHDTVRGRAIVEVPTDGDVRPMDARRIQQLVATPTWFQHDSFAVNTVAGVAHPSTFRGRVLSSCSTLARSPAVWTLRSVPFGKY